MSTPEDMRVGKPEPYAFGRDFTFNGYASTLDLANPAGLKAARQSPTVVMATPPHEQQPHEQQSSSLLACDPHPERSTESCEESWKQRFQSLQKTVLDVRNFRSGRQHGTVRAYHDVQVRFQGRRFGRLSERISGTGETIR